MPNLAEEMRQYGVDVQEVTGWESHARPYTFRPEGVMIHHTAGSNSLRIVRNGRRGLPGPLSQFLISKSGKVYLISQGYANHAGKGLSSVLARTREDRAPEGRARSRGDITGNRYYWGIEVENLGNGSDPYPEAQIRSLETLCAFLCEKYGWTENRVVHHKEWTSRKIDMSYNGDVRANVARIMKGDLPKSSPSSSSCEDSVFQTGDRGSCVEKIQRLLNQYGQSLSTDGIFGPNTETGVKKFQQSRSLTVDGIVGPKTWGELSKQEEKEKTTEEYPLLRSGSIHEAVNTVRKLLVKCGYNLPESGGLFDSNVKENVQKFQRHQGLSVDGIVGPNTWNALLSVAKAKAESEPTKSDNHEEKILEEGDKGPSVRHLQQKLLELDFDITVDGDFGPKTKAVVEHSQKVFRISVDGVVGPQTWGAYNAGYDLDKAAVFKGQASQALAMLIGKKWGIPAVSYLDKRSVRRAVLIGPARTAAGRYTEYRSVTGTLEEQVQKVYDEIV